MTTSMVAPAMIIFMAKMAMILFMVDLVKIILKVDLEMTPSMVGMILITS